MVKIVLLLKMQIRYYHICSFVRGRQKIMEVFIIKNFIVIGDDKGDPYIRFFLRQPCYNNYVLMREITHTFCSVIFISGLLINLLLNVV